MVMNSKVNGLLINNSQYIGEPAIIDGDLKIRGGDYERAYGLNNEILILYGTEAGYWGNLLEDQRSKIPGGMETLGGEPITSSFLDRHAAKAESVLNTMIVNSDARSIKAESFNPEVDRVESEIEIELSDGRKYFFDSEDCCGEFR